MKKCSLIFCFLLFFGCANSEQREDRNPKEQIGWMHGNCLAIKQDSIKTPRELTLVRLEGGNAVEAGVITGKARTGEECYPLLDDRKAINQAEGYSFYVVESKTPVDAAIGFLEPNNLKDLSFAYCSTAEGIRYSVMKAGVKIWEGYYYLGYDSEVTCDEES